MNITFRLETPADHHAVEEMTREAFWQFWEDDRKICDEHLLVHKLRKVPAFVPELDYIALVDGKIVGHIIFSRSWIESNNGKTYETLSFGPLTVLPEYQSKGVGRALMQYTFQEARKLGYRAVIIYGNPDYYPRVGFRRAVEFGLTTSDGSTFDAFMVYPLYEGALDGIHGKFYIDPVYEQLSEDEAFEFDKRFPPKPAHIPVPLDVLLDRLEPDAAKAIQEPGFITLDILKSLSEREISALPGMDAKAIEVVRTVMREYRYPWGENKVSNMKIRLAVHNDIEQICQLYNEFFAYNAEMDPVYCKAGKENGEYPKSVIESDSSDIIVAEEDETIIGFIRIMEGKTPPYDALVQHHYAQIIDFFTTAAHRKKGIGTQLMEASKQWAKMRNLEYIELFVLDGAKAEHRFYEHNGFAPVLHCMRCPL